jgi:hypothetical protein
VAATNLSLEHYLKTDYEPDCDYVDGELDSPRPAVEEDRKVALIKT